MHIVIISPYHTGSHKDWLQGYTKYTKHTIHSLTLPGQYWKWRMQGAAITLAREFVQLPQKCDLIVCTDMLDATTFLSMTRRVSSSVPVVVYFHENQLTYPLPNDKQRSEADYMYAFINYASAMVADRVCFNSEYHMRSFLERLPVLLKRNRDCRELESVEEIRKKSSVLHVGIDLHRLDVEKKSEKTFKPPLIIWNQRWEYDKNPEEFLKALSELSGEGVQFRLAVCGESFHKSDKTRDRFKEQLKPVEKHIAHIGYASSEEYKKLLWEASVTVSTAIHEFFGISIMEAVYCNTFPILPKRLSYPELIPKEFHEKCFYSTYKQLVKKLKYYLLLPHEAEKEAKELAKIAKQFDWKENMCKKYDDFFESVVSDFKKSENKNNEG